MDYNEYWRENTFELAARVRKVRDLLKTERAFAKYIRVGSVRDGGYLLDHDVQSRKVVSCGVDTNIDFEKDLVFRFNCTVDMYDYSVDGPPEPLVSSTFYKEKIGPENIDRILEGEHLILKMDIEGSEWDTLAAATKLGNCQQIALEAHWMLDLKYEAFYLKVVEALENLRKTHTPVWVHANNNQPLLVMGAQPVPNVFEALFLNNDFYKFNYLSDQFEGLVVPNDPNFPEIGLTFP